MTEAVDLSEAQARAQVKIEWAAALGLAGGLALALSRKRPVILTTVATTTSTAAAAGCFSVLQEGFRLARHKHDAWNSAAAGACAGAALVGIQAGPRYRLFGAVAWGTLCGSAHLLHNAIQPRQLLERLLVQVDLLDPPAKRRQRTEEASTSDTSTVRPGGVTAPVDSAPLTEDQKLRRKLAEVRKLRAKELEDLREAASQLHGGSPLQPTSHAAQASSSGRDAEGQTASNHDSKPQNRWWWRWRS